MYEVDDIARKDEPLVTIELSGDEGEGVQAEGEKQKSSAKGD